LFVFKVLGLQGSVFYSNSLLIAETLSLGLDGGWLVFNREEARPLSVEGEPSCSELTFSSLTNITKELYEIKLFIPHQELTKQQFALQLAIFGKSFVIIPKEVLSCLGTGCHSLYFRRNNWMNGGCFRCDGLSGLVRFKDDIWRLLWCGTRE